MAKTGEINNIIAQAVSAAIKYEKLTAGRKLGITGEVGEVLVCDKLKLKLADPRTSGYDALDNKGKKYQIKTRRGNTDSPGARMGTFAKHEFDYAVLAILDHGYNLVELYKAPYENLKSIIEGHRRRNPTLREFKNVAKSIPLLHKATRKLPH